MDPVERFPETFQLLGAYLHQDFDRDYGTVDEALRVAIVEADKDRLRAVGHELRVILAMPDSEDEAVVRALCYYYPPGDGRSWRGWLESVQTAVTQASGEGR